MSTISDCVQRLTMIKKVASLLATSFVDRGMTSIIYKIKGQSGKKPELAGKPSSFQSPYVGRLQLFIRLRLSRDYVTKSPCARYAMQASKARLHMP